MRRQSRAPVRFRSAATGAAIVSGMVAAGYAALIAAAWTRYGHAHAPHHWPDTLLDRLMPAYDIEERHHIAVAAEPALVFRVACNIDLNRSRIIRAIFRTRELVLGGEPDRTARPTAMVPLLKSIGWGVLAEVPDRELIMGGVTQPWAANPVFRSLPPDAFVAFDEPGYVKIAFTLRVEPIGEGHSLFLTETRAIPTSSSARARFRRYWSVAAPGIVLIRRLLLRPVKREAERQSSASTRTLSCN